jgi:RecB family exonuclease
MALAHSYSSIKQFENCPRQYHAVRILKQFKQADTEATLYGTAVHKAFEEYVRDGVELPEMFAQFKPYVEPLAKLDGTILCEQKMGMTADFKPCEFFAKDVWFRAIPDFLRISVKGTTAWVADYKTGKSSRYADTAQLELLAAMVMAHYPEVKKVKGSLLFVIAKDVVYAEHERSELSGILSRWVGRANMIEVAVDNGVWNPRKGPLCKFCPVTSCDHHPG